MDLLTRVEIYNKSGMSTCSTINETKVILEKKPVATRTGRPTELPEISHDCWREWDDHLIILKEYFRVHFQDMVSISRVGLQFMVMCCTVWAVLPHVHG